MAVPLSLSFRRNLPHSDGLPGDCSYRFTTPIGRQAEPLTRPTAAEDPHRRRRRM